MQADKDLYLVSRDESLGIILIMVIFIRSFRDRSYYVIGYGRSPQRFPHNNFSSVYRIFTKLGYVIPLWKGKNHIYFGVITTIPFDNLYRRAYFVMHTFLVLLAIVLSVLWYTCTDSDFPLVTSNSSYSQKETTLNFIKL